MKVLIISPRWPSPALAMRGMHTNEQFRIFRQSGCEIRAIVPVAWAPPGPRKAWRERRRVPSLERDHGVEILHPRHLSIGPLCRLVGGPLLQRRLYWRALAAEVSRFVSTGGDIVHIHSCGLPGAVLEHVRPAKLVVTMHDHEIDTLRAGTSPWRRPIVRTLLAADHVIYVSETLSRAGRELVGPHSASVIPLAIDDHPDVGPNPEGSLTIVTAARLVPGKNIALLIDALARVRASIPDARLVVIGDGPDRQSLERQAARLASIGAVEFLGHLPNRAVREHMARGHVFVLPSAPESLGTVYFEAMSVRVPIVGVRGQGIADYVTDGVDGFLIDPTEAEALDRIILGLHANPARRQEVGERGHALFERSGVRWRDYVSAHMALFDRMLRVTSSPRAPAP